MKQKPEPIRSELCFQSWLRPALTPVGRNCDYVRFSEQLKAVDAVLKDGHLESMAMDFAFEG